MAKTIHMTPANSACTLLFVCFIVLKITGYISVSWWVVICWPIIIALGLFGLMALIAGSAGIIAGLLKKKL